MEKTPCITHHILKDCEHAIKWSFRGGTVQEVGVVIKSYIPLSKLFVCSHQGYDKNSFLVLYSHQEHVSWTYTWFLSIAQSTDIHMLSSITICHRPEHELWCQDRLWTSTWLQAAAQCTDILMSSVVIQTTTSPQTLNPVESLPKSNSLDRKLLKKTLKIEIRMLVCPQLMASDRGVGEKELSFP